MAQSACTLRTSSRAAVNGRVDDYTKRELGRPVTMLRFPSVGWVHTQLPRCSSTSAELGMITSISAVTLATHDMTRALRFYNTAGFAVIYGGPDADFSSLRAGEVQFLNLIAQPGERQWVLWGRLIFYDSDVDALHGRLAAAGFRPDTEPRDAEWGERFFHIIDPDGHEISFAWPLRRA